MGIFARTKSIIVVAGLVVLGLLALYGLLHYQIGAQTKHIAMLRASVAEESRKVEEMRELERLLSDLSDDQQVLDSRFLTQESVVTYIELLEGIARDSGVVLEIVSVGIDPVSANAKDAWREWFRVAMRAEGSWQELFHFVRLIETLPYVTELGQLGIERSEEEGALWVGTFVLRTSTLTQP